MALVAVLVASLLIVGCGADEMVLSPDYGNSYYRSAELERTDVEVVETHDFRDVAPDRAGTANTGMFNSEAPYRLDVPVSEFATRSINTLPGTEPDELASAADASDDGSWKRLTGYYQLFTSDSMKDAYTGAFGASFMLGGPVTPDFDFGAEVGGLVAVGEPVERPDSRWVVDSSSLVSVDMPFNVFLLYPCLVGRTGTFRPYVGAGAGAVIGIEVMEAELSDFVSQVEVRNTVFRSMWTGEVMVGAELGTSAHKLVVELRFIASGRNSVAEGLSDEEKEERGATLYDALVRPDGRVTGATLCLGLRW
jgi:hypothetical protein